MSDGSPRMGREKRTLEAMLDLFCRGQHKSRQALCPDCQELLNYALIRLSKCPFQEGKMTCARCPVHCFKPAMRERIRAAMRYAGPRMIYRHPILALRHLADGLRQAPKRPGHP